MLRAVQTTIIKILQLCRSKVESTASGILRPLASIKVHLHEIFYVFFHKSTLIHTLDYFNYKFEFAETFKFEGHSVLL